MVTGFHISIDFDADAAMATVVYQDIRGGAPVAHRMEVDQQGYRCECRDPGCFYKGLIRKALAVDVLERTPVATLQESVNDLLYPEAAL